MSLQRKSVDTFGVVANDFQFMSKLRAGLRLHGIDPNTCEARRLRFDCMEVCGNGKVAHVKLYNREVQVIDVTPPPAKVVQLHRSINDHG